MKRAPEHYDTTPLRCDFVLRSDLVPVLRELAGGGPLVHGLRRAIFLAYSRPFPWGRVSREPIPTEELDHGGMKLAAILTAGERQYLRDLGMNFTVRPRSSANAGLRLALTAADRWGWEGRERGELPLLPGGLNTRRVSGPQVHSNLALPRELDLIAKYLGGGNRTWGVRRALEEAMANHRLEIDPVAGVICHTDIDEAEELGLSML